MSLAQGNNTPTRPRIEPGSPDPESDALTTRPVRPPGRLLVIFVPEKRYICALKNVQIKYKTYEPRREKTGFLHIFGNREADQRLCFRFIDSTIPLLSKSEISSL